MNEQFDYLLMRNCPRLGCKVRKFNFGLLIKDIYFQVTIVIVIVVYAIIDCRINIYFC